MIIHIPEYKKLNKVIKDTNINEAFFEGRHNNPRKIISGDTQINKNISGSIVKKYYLTRELDVIRILDYWDVNHYTINYNNNGISIDVEDHLFLPNKNIAEFTLFTFNKVNGDCNFTGNKFTSFKYFPKYIEGDCLANFNYIKDFKNVPYISGELIANKQKVHTKYPLTNENYLKYMNGTLTENMVYSEEYDAYGKLLSIDENKEYCTVSLYNSDTDSYKECKLKTNEVDCLESTLSLLK